MTIIDFKPSAYENFISLSQDKRLGDLAWRHYRELFDFPPERWGKLRTEFGKSTFVSDRHTPFIIKVVVMEDGAGETHIYVTEFSIRRS